MILLEVARELTPGHLAVMASLSRELRDALDVPASFETVHVCLTREFHARSLRRWLVKRGAWIRDFSVDVGRYPEFIPEILDCLTRADTVRILSMSGVPYTISNRVHARELIVESAGRFVLDILPDSSLEILRVTNDRYGVQVRGLGNRCLRRLDLVECLVETVPSTHQTEFSLNLESLDLSGNNSGFLHEIFPYMPSLLTFRASRCGLMKVPRYVLGLTNLETLDVSKNSLGTWRGSLLYLRDLEKLRHLDVSHTSIRDDDIFDEFDTFSRLLTADVSCTRLTKFGVDAILTSVRLESLVTSIAVPGDPRVAVHTCQWFGGSGSGSGGSDGSDDSSESGEL